MPLKLISSGGGSSILVPQSTGNTVTMLLPVSDGNSLVSNNHTGNMTINGNLYSSMPELFQSKVIVQTSDNRSLGASSTWVDHMSVAFTVTKTSPVFINVVFTMSYESDAVLGESRVELRGTATRTSDTFTVAQQSDQNRARGAHSFTYFFGNVVPGSYTAYLQVRNNNAGTWILNYYLGYDTMTVHYM
jgi:hypothetical protein